MLSQETQVKKRLKAEKKRIARKRPHEVHYFHQVDDPYSALLGQLLEGLVKTYEIELSIHLVPPPSDAAAPEREKLEDHSRNDASLIARKLDLLFDKNSHQPAADRVTEATLVLCRALNNHQFLDWVTPVSQWLWSDSTLPAPGSEQFDVLNTPLKNTQQEIAAELQKGDSLREELGHYLGGMLYYEGEWYWSVDRLHYLENRLIELGARKNRGTELLAPCPLEDLKPMTLINPPPIDFYFSLRSPYSAIVADRVFELGRATGAEVRLKFVLPMVMRGLPVPKAKRVYIVHDTAREAWLHKQAFGRLNDPVGKPTERGLSLIPLAETKGLGQAYVSSFMKGVWSEGLDAGSDKGLRLIAERAGLAWEECLTALQDERWRDIATQNREELFALGLWGVPSFAVGDRVFWGQDRLWAVQEAIIEGSLSPSQAMSA